jgi:hypothetical protein
MTVVCPPSLLWISGPRRSFDNKPLSSRLSSLSLSSTSPIFDGSKECILFFDRKSLSVLSVIACPPTITVVIRTPFQLLTRAMLTSHYLALTMSKNHSIYLHHLFYFLPIPFLMLYKFRQLYLSSIPSIPSLSLAVARYLFCPFLDTKGSEPFHPQPYIQYKNTLL